MSTAKPLTRSACAIASSLAIVGDKWSLLVMRDLLHGKHTYGELANSPERIPTNILADRLKRLEAAGIIASTPYQKRPTRYAYTLTPKGTALGDVLLAFVRWGTQYIPGTVTLNQERHRAHAARARKAPAMRRRSRTRAGDALHGGTSRVGGAPFPDDYSSSRLLIRWSTIARVRRANTHLGRTTRLGMPLTAKSI